MCGLLAAEPPPLPVGAPARQRGGPARRRLVSVGLLALVLAASLVGDQTPTRNLAPTAIWVAWWVGLAYVSALVGNLWAVVNPWSAVFGWGEALFGVPAAAAPVSGLARRLAGRRALPRLRVGRADLHGPEHPRPSGPPDRRLLGAHLRGHGALRARRVAPLRRSVRDGVRGPRALRPDGDPRRPTAEACRRCDAALRGAGRRLPRLRRLLRPGRAGPARVEPPPVRGGPPPHRRRHAVDGRLRPPAPLDGDLRRVHGDAGMGRARGRALCGARAARRGAAHRHRDPRAPGLPARLRARVPGLRALDGVDGRRRSSRRARSPGSSSSRWCRSRSRTIWPTTSRTS